VLALVVSGALSLPLLALLGFVGACGTVAFSVAAPALVPSLVASELLPRANGRIELARTTAFAGGPALGGALVGWIGGGPAFGLAAALSAAAVILLIGIVEPPRAKAPPQHPLRDVHEGIVFVIGHRLLRPIFITQFIFNTALFVILAVYVPYAVEHLQLSPAGVGITLGALGGGMVIGALFAARIMTTLRLGTVIAIGPLAGFAAALTMVATIWLPSAALAALSFFLMGAGPILWVVSTTTLRQTVTPPDLLGRVTAINAVAYGARPLGAAIGALAGALAGASTCLVIAAVGFLIQALVILASPVPRLAR